MHVSPVTIFASAAILRSEIFTVVPNLVRCIVCRPVATQSGRSATPGTSRFCVSVDILAVPDGENSDFLTRNLVDHTVVADT